MSEFAVTSGSRANHSPAAMPSGRASSDRQIGGVADWLRARLSLAGAGKRQRRALAIARAAMALEASFEALDDGALDDRRRMIAAALRRYGISTERAVQALALVREMCHRRIGKSLYQEQLAGGYALLHDAAIEMDTGEGKTLTSIVPSAVYAFCGRVVHVVTANDYLAARDGGLLKPVLEALGITVGIVTHGMNPAERREAYACDVTFVSSKEVAFDYLRDRLMMETVAGDMNLHLKVRRTLSLNDNRAPVLRGLDVAIVDEIDSVLVDEAGTPLLISAETPGDANDETIRTAFELASTFVLGVDFVTDRHGIGAELTDIGASKVEEAAGLLSGIWKHRVRRHELVRAAVTAIHCLENERHYLVREGKILIIDEYSGRVMADRYWGHDLHRMVEHKESCPASGSRKSLASVSFQRFFRSYRNLSGMSGTIREVAIELATVYGLSLTPIPRRRPLQRRFLGRTVFATRDALWQEAARRIAALHYAGRPVLVGVRTVEEAERGSHALKSLGIPHAVLSAAHDQQEAEIVARAGERAAVTIATNMAGRGTDIRLAEGVAEEGGLVVVICEKHDARRIDRQLMGRCARQGEPGEVMELLSREDRILRLSHRALVAMTFVPRLERIVGGWPFRHAQWRAERENAWRRYRLVKHDEQQRKTLAFAGGLD